ncbi:hypothetical protein QTP86_012991 [Hemibagrus guttatus]|nr:hypothetical protein QTP86_012991 [Hemibagrus guttatus]
MDGRGSLMHVGAPVYHRKHVSIRTRPRSNGRRWSDESCFLLNHVDGRVCGLPGEHIAPGCTMGRRRVGGGSVLLWAMFCWETLGPAVHVDVTLTRSTYLSIVADHVHPFMETLFPDGCGLFQQDKKAEMVQEWFDEHNNQFEVLTPPPNSPDLNPIQHLCDVLDMQVRSMEAPPRNLQDLKDLLLTSWCQIPQHTFRDLVESMPRRMTAEAILRLATDPVLPFLPLDIALDIQNKLKDDPLIRPELLAAAASLRDNSGFFQSEIMRPANDPKERDPSHVRMLNDVLRDLEKSFLISDPPQGFSRNILYGLNTKTQGFAILMSSAEGSEHSSTNRSLSQVFNSICSAEKLIQSGLQLFENDPNSSL